MNTDSSPFVRQVEDTVRNVLQKYGAGSQEDSIDKGPQEQKTRRSARTKGKRTSRVDHIPPEDRETVLIARCLSGRLAHARQHNVCPHCWLQRPDHCFCSQCPAVPVLDDNLDTSKLGIRRIFLLLHYREVFMGVDTAKLILKAFPETTRLVIAGIPAQYQASMAELEDASRMSSSPRRRKLCVLFPDEAAKTIGELQEEYDSSSSGTTGDDTDVVLDTITPRKQENDTQGWDVVVIDGTWQQARRMKLRYFPGDESSSSPSSYPMFPTVKLSPAALALLQDDNDDHGDKKSGSSSSSLPAGHQLRKHSIPWKRIATFEALRLFLVDCSLLLTAATKTSTPPTTPEWLIQIQDLVRIANQAALGRSEKWR